MKCHAGYIFVAVISVILCLSCGNDADVAKHLDDAEFLMDSDACAALGILESVDSSALDSRRLRARYALSSDLFPCQHPARSHLCHLEFCTPCKAMISANGAERERVMVKVWEGLEMWEWWIGIEQSKTGMRWKEGRSLLSVELNNATWLAGLHVRGCSCLEGRKPAD